ncbi:MAG: hypothetical protein IKT19_00250 [Paludibacteraceae bacterium]|nr:hypothetical protein [Paludibacteraceae bacterium]
MKHLLPIVFIALTFCACTKSRTYFPKDLEPQPVEIVRFDNALLNINAQSALQDIRIISHEYPTFFPFFVENILGVPANDTDFLAKQLPLFLQDTLYGFKQTNERERILFASTQDLENELSKAFARVHYLYPDLPIPTIYLFISGFNASILFADDDIAVGADMYLGSDYEYYNRVVHDYQKVTMRKECIPVDVVSAHLFRYLPYTSTKSRLIDNMIYRGKIMYLLSQIFSDIPAYEVMGYTKEQWSWCVKHERAVWHLMMDKKDLFKNESLLLTSYLNEGPFTGEISQDAPGRIGTWIGWRIAESYMNHHPEITMQQLIAEPDAEHILQESFYRP